MPRIVDLRASDDRGAVLRWAAELLTDGQPIVLPSETEYSVVAAIPPAAGASAGRMKETSRAPEASFVVAVFDASEAIAIVPDLSRAARRLLRRCTPGPVTFVFASDAVTTNVEFLPSAARQAIISHGWLRVRVVGDSVLREVLSLMKSPLRLLDSPASRVATAQEAHEHFGADVALVIDGGPPRYAAPTTEIRFDGDDWSVSRIGAVGQRTLIRSAGDVHLFVCTGNTCRSPMAEALFRKYAAEQLQCAMDDLIDRGLIVLSAGLLASAGQPASPEAIAAVRSEEIDLRGHASQPLTDRLLDHADHVYVMTHSHRDSILAGRPDAADRVTLLADDGSDIADPFGGTSTDYEHCRDQIARYVRAILAERAST